MHPSVRFFPMHRACGTAVGREKDRQPAPTRHTNPPLTRASDALALSRAASQAPAPHRRSPAIAKPAISVGSRSLPRMIPSPDRKTVISAVQGLSSHEAPDLDGFRMCLVRLSTTQISLRIQKIARPVLEPPCHGEDAPHLIKQWSTATFPATSQQICTRIALPLRIGLPFIPSWSIRPRRPVLHRSEHVVDHHNSGRWFARTSAFAPFESRLPIGCKDRELAASWYVMVTHRPRTTWWHARSLMFGDAGAERRQGSNPGDIAFALPDPDRGQGELQLVESPAAKILPHRLDAPPPIFTSRPYRRLDVRLNPHAAVDTVGQRR